MIIKTGVGFTFVNLIWFKVSSIFWLTNENISNKLNIEVLWTSIRCRMVFMCIISFTSREWVFYCKFSNCMGNGYVLNIKLLSVFYVKVQAFYRQVCVYSAAQIRHCTRMYILLRTTASSFHLWGGRDKGRRTIGVGRKQLSSDKYLREQMAKLRPWHKDSFVITKSTFLKRFHFICVKMCYITIIWQS